MVLPVETRLARLEAIVFNERTKSADDVANLDYVAMMTDVDIPDKEEEESNDAQ